MNRRSVWPVLLSSAGALLSACASVSHSAASQDHLPIVFVHGNGDSAAMWNTTMWRFESNGWPRDHLFAFDLAYPLARDLDDVAQEGRSSARDDMEAVAAQVDRALAATGASKVILIANSRGGIAVRNYILNGGGKNKVSAAILGGTPNHGVFVDPHHRLTNEFNGAGPLLHGLNTQNRPGDLEVTPGPRWLTVRSDKNDKYAQPEGTYIGAKGFPTGVTARGPELRGATNVVIPGADHSEVSFGPQAFAADFRFLTHQEPATLGITPERNVVLNGKVFGLGLANEKGDFPSNLPLVGARVSVFETQPLTGERKGGPLREVSIGTDGRWGPFDADGKASYEFVIAKEGYATTHIYRNGFLRSSSVINLQAGRLSPSDRDLSVSVVTLSRPRGFLGVPRDRITLDGKSPPDGIPPGVPSVASVQVRIPQASGTRPVVAEVNGERVVGRTWPASQGHIVVLEMQY